MTGDEIMNLGIEEAQRTMQKNIGGPFGAVVVKNGEVISVSSNHVLAHKDPTAHAEIEAIREASAILDTYDLRECELYATGYPCPMCMGAIIWSNIKKIHVSGLPEDADHIGFRDDFMYDYIRSGCQDEKVLDIEQMDRSPAQGLYRRYAEMNKTIY